MIGRDLVFVEDCVHRTYRLAVGAVDAGSGIDVIHLLIVRGGDATDRADLKTRCILNPDTGLGDNVGQNILWWK